MEELDHGSFHPSIKHLQTDMSQLVFEPLASSTAGGRSTKELVEQLLNSLFITSTVHGGSSACGHQTWTNTRRINSNVGRIAFASSFP
jgi:hypothetical protein